MVTPYTARGYGIFDEVKGKFKNPDDPFEYIPVKLKALTGRSRATDQESATGVLSARRPAEHVPVPAPLPDDGNEPQPPAGADVLPALPRRGRAGTGRPRLRCRRGHGEVSESRRCRPRNAWSATRRSIPSPGCSRTTASFEGVYGRRKGGWFKDMFAAGFEGEKLPGQGTLAGPAMARRAHREGPALRRRHGRARLLHPDGPQGPARLQRTWTIRFTPPGGAPIRSSAARSRPIAERFVEVRLQPQERLQGLDRVRLLPRRRLVDRGDRQPAPPGGAGRRRRRAACSPRSRSSGRWTPSSASAGASSRTSWRCSTAASTPRRSPSAPPTRAGPWGRSSALLSNDVACRHTLRDFALQARQAAPVPGHRARLSFPAPPRGRRGDPPGHRPSARAHPGPPRRRRIPRRSRARSTSSPASSPTPSEQKGLDEAARPTPAGPTSPALLPTPSTPSAPGAAWSPTCSDGPNSFTSNRLHAPTRLPQAVRPGRPRPGRPAPLPAPDPRRSEGRAAMPGPYYVVFNASGGWDTTYLMDPKGIDGINRLYKEGDILTHGAHKFAPTAKHIKGGMSNEDFYARVRQRTARAQRAGLLGQQPLARRPLHGDRQARQHGLPDVRRPRRRLPGAGLPAVVPDLRQLLGDRQPRGDVARAVPASRCGSSPTPTPSTATTARPITTSFALDRIERRSGPEVESRGRTAAPAAGRARGEHALRGPGQLEGPAAGHPLHPRARSPRSACRSRPTSPWPPSRRASASRRT